MTKTWETFNLIAFIKKKILYCISPYILLLHAPYLANDNGLYFSLVWGLAPLDLRGGRQSISQKKLQKIRFLIENDKLKHKLILILLLA